MSNVKRKFKPGTPVICNGNPEGRILRYPYHDSTIVEVRLMDGCRYVGDVAVDDVSVEPRVFAGVYSTGISYADRAVEVNGDYKRLAFLSFKTLELDIAKKCPGELRSWIQADAAAIQARRGERYPISASGQYIILGQ